jgi:hypothetical protein
MYLIIGPYIIEKCLKFTQEKAAEAFFNGDMSAGFLAVFVMMAYVVNTLSLVDRLIKGLS